MGFKDRAVARARQHLVDGEGIVAIATGIEADGRRRQVVLLTDRRLLVAGLRSQPPTELDPDGVSGSFDDTGALLTLRDGDQEVVLRSVDPRAGRQVLGLLGQRRPSHLAGGERIGTVRIVS